MAGGEAPARKSDLGVRTASAVVMLAVAGGALWAGGWWWTALVAILVVVATWEWQRLVVRGGHGSPLRRGLWVAGGLGYIGLAAYALWYLRLTQNPTDPEMGLAYVALLIATVIGVDVGAYAAGRTFGGPKIAPRISPSKTWAGLIGGSVMATLVIASYFWVNMNDKSYAPLMFGLAAIAGPTIAVLAQIGDFFESWMKRRAGMKDSSNLIPGHGGVLDRVDGLLAVSAPIGLILAARALA